jgi:hypothetical protein
MACGSARPELGHGVRRGPGVPRTPPPARGRPQHGCHAPGGGFSPPGPPRGPPAPPPPPPWRGVLAPARCAPALASSLPCWRPWRLPPRLSDLGAVRSPGARHGLLAVDPQLARPLVPSPRPAAWSLAVVPLVRSRSSAGAVVATPCGVPQPLARPGLSPLREAWLAHAVCSQQRPARPARAACPRRRGVARPTRPSARPWRSARVVSGADALRAVWGAP